MDFIISLLLPFFFLSETGFWAYKLWFLYSSGCVCNCGICIRVSPFDNMENGRKNNYGMW